MVDDVMFPLSQALLERARKTDAWAATRGAILENDKSNASYPQYVSRAEGAYVWDVDGNRYIDFVLGYGPVVLGHGRQEVVESYVSELRRGICISPFWSPCQSVLTDLICDIIPCAESAYLMRTGSDATSAAVRLARIFTGRDKILKWGYNGWHDWTAPRPEGVPLSVRGNTLSFEFNSIETVERAFADHPNDIACVIMMPFELEAPAPGFLESVIAVARRNGALFILDEMRSGFRMALGGAQEYLDIRPDLATFSKAMANGFAISAVTGRRDVMLGLARTHMSSTYYANPAEMAAAVATITILRESDVVRHLWRLGDRFQSGLRDLLEVYEFPADVVGYPIAPYLLFREGFDIGEASLKAQFFRETTCRGLLLHPNHQWFMSGAHTEDDIDVALAICEDAMRIVKSFGKHP